ncbi:MAG: hypothetical protein RL385_1090 [Pseudomonadota bacterium]|jgi:hypothetical protein
MIDAALALRWGAIAARHGRCMTLPWLPDLLAMLLPVATFAASDGGALELRGTVEGAPFALGMLLPLVDGQNTRPWGG